MGIGAHAAFALGGEFNSVLEIGSPMPEFENVKKRALFVYVHAVNVADNLLVKRK